MRHTQLDSILTAAIVDYCQRNDLYLTELHIQGTVCISSDGTPTLITQLCEKVSTNNNRYDISRSRKTLAEEEEIQDESSNLEETPHEKDEHQRSRSPTQKNRRKSDPGYHYQRSISESYKEAESYRWAITSTQGKGSTHSRTRTETINLPISEEHHSTYRSISYDNGEKIYYKSPKKEPIEISSHQRHSQNEYYDSLEAAKKSSNRVRSVSMSQIQSHEEEEGRRDGRLLMQPWRPLINEQVSAATMSVYAYMHNPTYQSSRSLSSSQIARHLLPGNENLGSEDLRHNSSTSNTVSIHGQDGPQQQILGSKENLLVHPGSISHALVSHPSDVNLSRDMAASSSPPPQSPSLSPHKNQSPMDVDPRLPTNSAPYMTFRSSREHLAHVAGDKPLQVTSPSLLNIKPEAQEELHIVTRPFSSHVPGMVSPSAQAAASAMAALSSLQASIMPATSQETPATKSSPTSTIGSTITSSSRDDHEEEHPDSPPPEENSSPESPDIAMSDMAALTSAGCLQIPDAPVNSHFRKMMLKSLQGKYKVLKTAEGRYKCPVCGVSYVYQPNLRKHLEKVHLGKSYKCEFCGQKFTSVQGYSFHRKVKHRELMPYRCELCREAFYSYTAFLQHKKRSHSNHPECVAVTNNQNLLHSTNSAKEMEKKAPLMHEPTSPPIQRPEDSSL